MPFVVQTDCTRMRLQLRAWARDPSSCAGNHVDYALNFLRSGGEKSTDSLAKAHACLSLMAESER